MPKLLNVNPKYRRHRSSGQAIVSLSNHVVYLGEWKSKASKIEYDRVISEWLANGRRWSREGAAPADLSVVELVAEWRRHAVGYYRREDGSSTGETERALADMKPMLDLFAELPARDYSPLKLKTTRNEMIRRGWCRTTCNYAVGSIKRAFRWAAENELVPAEVAHGLWAVAGLKRGRSEAREPAPVRPVPVEYAHAVLPHVSRQVAAMIRLQLLTGMRPGEVTAMRGCDIDTTGGKLWSFRPARHKTQHHGHERIVFLGANAQEIIRPFLKPDVQAYLFSPADADAEHRERRAARRKTPKSCGNRPGSNRVRRRRKRPGERYAVKSYRAAVVVGCDRADRWAHGGRVAADGERIVPRFHPHQLRHTAATELRRTFGLEGAQVALGHATLAAAQLYAERNTATAQRIAAAVG